MELQALIDGQTEPDQLVSHIGHVKASRVKLLESLRGGVSADRGEMQLALPQVQSRKT